MYLSIPHIQLIQTQPNPPTRKAVPSTTGRNYYGIAEADQRPSFFTNNSHSPHIKTGLFGSSFLSLFGYLHNYMYTSYFPRSRTPNLYMHQGTQYSCQLSRFALRLTERQHTYYRAFKVHT
ncbi:hypothetical protein M426DRAFT_177363 [Hypoxylon sp. CI-4A]|nr:hypothetical protein M426DRAFT_177363 [Hypoxylon sp. CI-4A]